MLAWLEALIAALSASILIIIILYFLIRHRFSSKQQVVVDTHRSPVPPTRTPPFQTSIKRPGYPLFRRGTSAKPVFNWADHPSLIVDAVENGWSRFAFAKYTPSPSLKSPLLCVTGDNNSTHHNHVDLSWEVGHGSSDFMQQIRFHKPTSSSVRMTLPLPGPPPSFPQEAYFEIRVIKSGDDHDDQSSNKGRDREDTNLINYEKNSSSSTPSSSILTGNSSCRLTHVLEEIKVGGGRRGRGQEEGVRLSVGLAVGGSPMTGKLPGSYPGSVGFNSDGSVYLAGMKLSYESEKEDWAQVGKVIGCGFNPMQKKVFFTVDSEMIHVIHCKSEDFRMPLYPILTANIDATVLVNLGQSSFSFAPANAQRTPNPCFIGPIVNSSASILGDEDSRELFSIGRIDVEWLSHNTTIRSTVSYEESEVDLFEIVLDNNVGGKTINEHRIGK